jgi:hypothetical protein
MLRAHSGAPGFRSARSLRSHASLHPHFCKPWKPTVSFVGLAKTSYTPGTLCAIKPEIYKSPRPCGVEENKINKMISKMIKNIYCI